MTELPFGSAPTMWAGVSSPGAGWFQPPVSFGAPSNSAPGAGSPPFLSLPAVQGPIRAGSFVGTNLGASNGPALAAVPEVTVTLLLNTVAIRRGQPYGPTTDQELEDFLYDCFDLIPGTNEADVRCENGRATITGAVPHKRLKRDIGEIAWAIPSINDVQNNVTITSRRRSRTGRESEPAAAAGVGGPARKQG
jgi:hypothetical protein